MIKAYLGLGSNIGNSVETLEQALHLLNASSHIEVTTQSSIYRTNPIGYVEQPDFYNLVAEVKTSLSPKALLSTILQVEQELQRVRTIRWGPRTMDIDILLYGDSIIHQPQLHIPHPRMMERGFVLVPLYEIAGDLSIPGVEGSLKDRIKKLLPEQKVEKLDTHFSG